MVNKWITDMSLTGNGLRDWLTQRFSSIILGVYFLVLSIFFLTNPHLDYSTLRDWFATTWVQIFTLIVLINLFLHAWVGIWTVITDYVKSTPLRLILQVIVILVLAIYFFWGVVIIWKVA